jgi:tetratricopeptide (TPR) repeat protein
MKKSTKKVTRPAAKAAPANTWMIQEKALKDLERGVNHLHKQQYADALKNFDAIIEGFPDDRELLDRVRVYKRICESRLTSPPETPKDPASLFYLGVMRANEADFDGAVGFLEQALQANPGDEKVHYVLASTLAMKGEREGAVDHLRQAIDRNAINRIHARNDPDFEPIRDDDALQNLLYPEEA